MSQAAFILIVAISTLIDLVIAALALGIASKQRDGGRRIGLWEMFGTAIVSAVVFGVKLPVLGFLGINTFGTMCVAYIDLAVTLPLLALGLLMIDAAARWRRRADGFRLTPAARAVTLIVAIAGPAIGVYATFLETRNLRFERASVALPRERAGSQAIRIGVLADIQTNAVTAHEREAVARLMAAKPDLILIPGDIFQGFPSEFRDALADLRELLRQLHAPGGVFFVFGDCDQRDRTLALLEGSDIRILENEIAETRIGDRRIVIGGLELNYATPAAQAAIAGLHARQGDNDVRILLSHRPDSVQSLPPNSRIDLVIAGHTHGGQVQLPGIGPLITLSRVPNTVAAGGLHEMDGNCIYVSRGLGRERGQAPSIRFLCPPEITLLTLQD
jgi:uncharacterized protein